MKTIWTITKRELWAYFTSPVAYVFIVIFLLLAAAFTLLVSGFFERGVADLIGFTSFSFRQWACVFGQKNSAWAQ